MLSCSFKMKSLAKVVLVEKLYEKKERFTSLFAAGVLGHCLGSLADCMLGKFTRQVQSHSDLDFAAGDGVFLAVASQARGFGGNALKDVVHEGVHDAHGFAGDASVRMHLL